MVAGLWTKVSDSPRPPRTHVSPPPIAGHRGKRRSVAVLAAVLLTALAASYAHAIRAPVETVGADVVVQITGAIPAKLEGLVFPHPNALAPAGAVAAIAKMPERHLADVRCLHVGGWRRSSLRHFPADAPGCLVVRRLPAVARVTGAERRTPGAPRRLAGRQRHAPGARPKSARPTCRSRTRSVVDQSRGRVRPTWSREAASLGVVLSLSMADERQYGLHAVDPRLRPLTPPGAAPQNARRQRARASVR